MTVLALTLYLAFAALALGGRMWLQYRRTGDLGWRGPSGTRGPSEWLGGALTRVHGAPYVSYARAVGRFVPGVGVWRR